MVEDHRAEGDQGEDHLVRQSRVEILVEVFLGAAVVDFFAGSLNYFIKDL